MQDTISCVLDLLGVRSAVYFQTDFCAPWGMDVSDTGFAQFHMIVSGEAVIRHPDGLTIALSSGDLVVYPTGAPHAICDSADSPTVPGEQVVGGILNGQPVFADGTRRTRIICGHFAYDLSYRHPLISELPTCLVLRSSDILGTQTLLSLLQLIIRETNRPTIGSQSIVRRLSDAVFVAVLRSHILKDQPTRGFVAALRDPRLANCIGAIHSKFPETPSLESLARVSGMSRSSLALKFQQCVGFGPGEYAKQWKLLNAAQMLEQSDRSVEEISFACGYRAPSSFSRAFRQFFGQAASEYRVWLRSEQSEGSRRT